MREWRPVVRWVERALLREDGATLAMVAVCMVSLLAFLALCVDLAMAYTARGEAQRVADAAALAGASAFVDYSRAEDAVDPAKERVKEFAARNNVRSKSVDTLTTSESELRGVSEDLAFQVVPDSLKVRVWVRRSGISTFFARFLGVNVLSVQAMAAAEAGTGGSATCVWPFSGPDLWEDGNGDDGDRIPEDGEPWSWDGEGVDHYAPWDGADGGTGYGSPFRNGMRDDEGNTYVNDYGRPITIKTTSEGQAKQGRNPGGLSSGAAPGNFMLWAMPDPDADCAESGQGAQFVYENMTGCNSCEVSLDEEYATDTEPGQKWGKVLDALNEVMAEDPGARWDPRLGLDGDFTGSRYPQGTSPRMVPIALAHPDQHPSVQGRDEIVFNNFAMVFIDGVDKDKVVHARFVGYVSGGTGKAKGSLIRYLRLVQ